MKAAHSKAFPEEVDRLLMVAARIEAGLPLGTLGIDDLIQTAGYEAGRLGAHLPAKAQKTLVGISQLLAQRMALPLLLATEMELRLLDELARLHNEDHAVILHRLMGGDTDG